MANNDFTAAAEKHLNLLKQYTPVLAKVHGQSHPELSEVRDLVKSLTGKIKNNDRDLQTEFTRLKEITGNYEVPADGCETYEAVYSMLRELDEAYIG